MCVKISLHVIKVAEAKPPLMNQQCVVYKFRCDLCDADYFGCTRRHLFQRNEEHKRSSSGAPSYFGRVEHLCECCPGKG